MSATVAIIGAGIGGIYLVAELGIARHTLRLHDIDNTRLADIRAHGGLDVEGEPGGFAAVEHATTDLRSAVDGADVIIVATGGNAQATVARSLAPILRDGQVILLFRATAADHWLCAAHWTLRVAERLSMSPRWTTIRIPAGGWRRRGYGPS